MMVLLQKISLLLFIFLTFNTFASAMADVVVIGNTSNTQILTKENILNLYLGKKRLFPDGSKAKLLNQKEGTTPRKEFFANILQKNEVSFMTNWSTIIFTGNGTPPKVLDDDQSIKSYIKRNPDAIGYIDKKSLDDSVKVLFSPE